MGLFLNPSYALFSRLTNSPTFVDKSEVLVELNSRIDTSENAICLSRPRRFGKSCNAYMLCAYYSKGCDSSKLFDNLKIATAPSYKHHLNAYHTIFIDMNSAFFKGKNTVSGLIEYLENKIIGELKLTYPALDYSEPHYLSDLLKSAYATHNAPFIVIIDEWDAPLREQNDEANAKLFLAWLNDLLKGNEALALVYMTGILPVRKYGNQSALNMFTEPSVLQPCNFAAAIGFTEDEVLELCLKHNANFDELKAWYDGYCTEDGLHIYNSNSVVQALISNKIANYWSQTEQVSDLPSYLALDNEGLALDVIHLLNGEILKVNTKNFANSLYNLGSKDQVETLLVHLGYLSIVPRNELPEDMSVDYVNTYPVRIPNKELYYGFRNALELVPRYQGVYELIGRSEQFVKDILAGNEQAVADSLDLVRQENDSLLNYNKETSIAYTVSLAMYASANDYTKHYEIPAGKGFADVMFTPRPGHGVPPIIIELKRDVSAKVAIKQIKARNYINHYKAYRELYLVGISYNTKKNKKHTCIIEKVTQF